ncbi:leucine-rich repeat domain-containing protein [Bacteroides sp. Ga6A2]|uniref:leucine-rich repeat domain-containing protein n=1 Tax=Bacteroides sp. Ga6A2 TaxID=1410608 RepID=UPI0012DC5631|nr:leucine-rich repeat domain-containing protein [Bacteroides sp. Ga6A2]
MLKEQTTTYAYKLKYLENPTFDRIRASANTFINELPSELRDELYDSLNRGTDLLDSEPSMLVYLFSFGKMHQAKLNYAFSKIPDGFMEQSEINIIDYGCGQAIGTMCYADYLKACGNKQKIKSITLIEPSEICLKRAALHASVFFPDAEITTINKKFDELDGNDISTSEDTPTLHILSNVLDLDFDLQKFSELIKSKLVGYNQFVCVDPYFGYSDKDQRMNKFANLIGGNVSFSKILEKGELNPDKNWTCQTVILSVGELEEELSTKVTDEEIQNGITDEYGVVYSRDGKRLLKCENWYLWNYEIKKGTKVICDSAFERCKKSLESITIPSSVTSIGYRVFSRCKLLREIKIVDNPLFVVDSDMLIDQKNMELLAYFGTKNDVTIPSSVTSIGDRAFYACSSLKSIVIPSSVTSIGECAFEHCDSLKSIVIPSSVTSIGDRAFCACFSLESISIPSSVTSLGNNAFGYCISLKSITIPSSVTSIGECAFEHCDSLKSIVIPSSVTSIGDSAFYYCSSLESIVLSSSVTSIGNNAFRFCSSLESIVLPSSVTSIGECAFEHCSSLESIVLSSSVTSIGNNAFRFCSSLESIVLPSSVTSIGDRAFSGCKLLREIKIIDNPFFVVENDMLIDFMNAKLLAYFGTKSHATIPSSVTSIGKSAFSGCSSLESIIIPSSVTSIGDCAFWGCSSLESITIPSSVTSIGKSAFEGCNSLKSISIPSSVTGIGGHAFECCSSLETVTIPSSVTSIGWSAFSGCSSLKSIIIPENSVEQFKKMLPNSLWDKLYYLKKAVDIEESDSSDLP